MKIQHPRPPSVGRVTLRRKATNRDRGSFGSSSLESEILRLTHLEHWACTRDQNTAGPGGCHRLKMNLLIVDHMFVIEGDIFRIQEMLDGLMERIRGLCNTGHCEGKAREGETWTWWGMPHEENQWESNIPLPRRSILSGASLDLLLFPRLFFKTLPQ